MPTDALTVTQFVQVINATLDALDAVTVEGEIIEYKLIQNKWVVFDLKDAKSVVKCFMPIWNARTPLEDGMQVRVVGRPKQRDKGFFSFTLDSAAPTGEGSLKRAFELLKQKLEHEGLFSPERKRLLPRFPQRIALVTSRDAAAYTDFLKVLKGRQGGITVNFIHTAVQGEDAPTKIIEALAIANSVPGIEALVLIRGGGSMEDLQAFNDELVVRAVATSRVPTVVGIGHERDVTLAELAADQRASTPSNAAELLVRSREELLSDLGRYENRLSRAMHQAIQTQSSSITHATNVLRARMTSLRRRLDAALFSLHHHMTDHVARSSEQLTQLTRLLTTLSPEQILARGYSITKTANGHVIKDASSVKNGEVITTQLAKGVITATVGKRKQLDLGL
jgi:exodeoxyribonuclease VII large subunit